VHGVVADVLVRMSDQFEGPAVQYEISRGDLAVGGLGILLVIDLLCLPWFSTGGISIAATSAPDGWPAVLAVVVSVLGVVDLIVERFAPQVIVPTLGGTRAATRFGIASVLPLLVLLKLVLQWSSFKSQVFHVLGAGFWGALFLAAGLVIASRREM
jgi:hypothetical protein